MNISIVIPNYNGEVLLKQNLKKVYDALLATPGEKKELIVADDNSRDSSLEILENFKTQYSSKEIEVILVINKINKGFSSNVNSGVRVACGDIVLLLNTDVAPDEESFLPLLSHFDDPEVFAVGCMDRSIEEGKEVLRGRGIGRFERGFLLHNRGKHGKSSTLLVSGGSGAFRRELWNKLGGLDEVYNPFYWEDIDLSYRAMKSGYKVLFEEKSVVTHEHEKGVIKKKFSPERVRVIVYRNQFIFVWKNITDSSLIAQHILWLPYHIGTAILRRDTIFLRGFFEALKRFPTVLSRRKRITPLFVATDRSVISPVRA